MSSLRTDHPALLGRTIFLKTVKPPTDVKRMLQPAASNSKLGAGKTTITRGRWRGMPMYQLTLEERRTCPTTCQQWNNCYGNGMPFANRLDHRAHTFLSSLATEVAGLVTKHPTGFVIRLHVLGDFFSKSYVQFWKKLLRRHTALHLFGYTHRMPEHPDGIGKKVLELNALGAWIRFSDRGGDMSANFEGEGIPCPQQTGKTASCLTCGLCWQTTKPIRFEGH